MTPDLHTIVDRLGARKEGSTYKALCPAHDDRNPSLGITERNGTVLVKCYAGCAQTDVISALRAQGLWPEAQRREHADSWGTIVCTYDYTDEDGQLLYQVCRFEPKSFRPRRPNAHGGWTWGYGSVRRVLYRLREVIEAPIVFVVEGEKDVETLREYGFVATTNAGGANGWRSEYNEYLRGREVILIPDNDEPGRRRVLDIARQLLGVSAKRSILTLDGGKDVTDWFTQGHSELELISMLEDSCHAL